MSSLKLPVFNPLSKETSSSIFKSRAPIHACFSSRGDVLGVLHHGGLIQLWRLDTYIPDPGSSTSREPVYKPSQLCDTALDVSEHVIEPRQISVWGYENVTGNTASSFNYRIACLAAHEDSDVVSVLDIVGAKVAEATRVIIPGQHGRLLYSDDGVYWQSRTGELFTGEQFFSSSD